MYIQCATLMHQNQVRSKGPKTVSVRPYTLREFNRYVCMYVLYVAGISSGEGLMAVHSVQNMVGGGGA